MLNIIVYFRMDISLGAGLGIFGKLINNNINNREKKQYNSPDYENSYPINYLNNYDSDIMNTRSKVLYNSISDLYKESENKQ